MTTIAIPAIPAALAASALFPATTDLSVRLFHPGVLPADALKAGHGLLIHPCPIGKLYYHATKQDAPDWSEFLERGAPGIKPLLHSQHSSAVLLLEAGPASERRLFAFCFGQGHHAIEQDFIERQFGMRVVLNSVSRKDLRVLDTASLDSTVMQRRTQASRDSDLNDFGLDTNKELLRLASGTPNDRNIAKAISGKDALQIRKKLAFADLPTLCNQLLDLYNATDYKTDFGFIDQIKPLHKGALTDTLDAVLMAELTNMATGAPSELHLAVPDILPTGPGSQLSYRGARMPRSKRKFDTLAIDDYLAELNEGGFATSCDINDIRTHLVCTHNNDPTAPSGQMKVYDCIVFETQHNNNQYVLFDGQWYEVSRAYYQDIQQYYLDLKKTPFLSASTAANEQELIAELCTTTYPHLLCIDKTKINPAGVSYANLEVCDFVSHSKQLIHLKDSASSAPLSHLFNQGLVSAEALRRDSTVRTKFRKVAGQREVEYGRNGFVPILPTAARIVPSEWTVVFGVLKKTGARSGTLDLPFFSKVALRAAADRISLMGYQVELHLIEKR
ncbi:hypothetical protein GJ697_05890 [Pseudoduganella sp. FT25W]|jgi:uncharacterized protein (TIGR04141 family)|uniref:Sporadically distributed protein, TIGR04141 family n=1 Tax=Duganella alba TaxID=2666081 RepID=A0A6L5QDJ5_9BURK|nr:DUF6119 family protein [Duganella alba]MRX07362.1 hypothetical protein [Duganella alba]MRX19464.1 hypothetical protein [Duganella alba]